MFQSEFDSELPFSQNTYACAPSYNNESLFFNLMLNTNYENTKENCLIFLTNYSKHIMISKRDLFKNVVNELTLNNQISNKNINNDSDESIYLLRTFIKKYSRINIINAIFEFVQQNEDNSDQINIYSSNTTNDVSSIGKKDNVEKIENKEEIKEKEQNDKDNLNQEIINATNNKKKRMKNSNLLKKKRKHDFEEHNSNSKEIKRKNSLDTYSAKNGINMSLNHSMNIKKEMMENEQEIDSISDSVKIKQEKDDFFKKSFEFEEKAEYKKKLRIRNKSVGIKKITNKISHSPIIRPLKKKLSVSSRKGRKIGRKSNNINEENKLEEKDIRSHMIKINGIVVSYNRERCENNNNNNNNYKIVFLCNNIKCKGKGVYNIDKKTFEETEKHNLKKISHGVSIKNKNIKEQLIKDTTCDGYQLLKKGKFIKDKKVILLK